MKKKIYDCITFYDENDLVNLRIDLLYKYVDMFIICEALYDHSGNKKKLNFKLHNKKHKKKIIHLVLKEKFPENSTSWDKEKIQREYIFKALNSCNKNDLIIYSDSDEIINPKVLRFLKLKKKYGIFMQQSFSYKFYLMNPNETPWPGSRICKFVDLKSFTYLRKKVWPWNLKYKFWRVDKEKNIQVIKNGGWHFQNFYSEKKISRKLKVYPHKEQFSDPKYSSISVIKKKIIEHKDLFTSKKLIKVNIKNFLHPLLFNLIKKNFNKSFIYEKK